MNNGFPPKERFLRTIWNFTHIYNKNFLMAITGDPGEGKSFSALKIGEKLDPHFSVDKVAFTAKDFMDVVVSVKHKGEVVIFDECGVGLPARSFYELSNKLVNFCLQTFRKDNACVIFVTPDLSFIDVQARKLMRCYGEAVRYATNPVMLWLYRISINRKTGKVYFPHPVYTIDGVRQKFRYAIIHKPSEEIIEAYIEKADKWKEKLKVSVHKAVELMEKGPETRTETIYDLINKINQNPEEYMINGKIRANLISAKLGISISKASQIRAILTQQKKVAPKD